MVRWLFKKSSMKTGSRVYPTVTEHLELLRNNEENMILNETVRGVCTSKARRC